MGISNFLSLTCSHTVLCSFRAIILLEPSVFHGGVARDIKGGRSPPSDVGNEDDGSSLESFATVLPGEANHDGVVPSGGQGGDRAELPQDSPLNGTSGGGDHKGARTRVRSAERATRPVAANCPEAH